uniref:Uncharacterized protein n=1 Tax=Rhizophagus irregularis (strain DAOM 181602 / DAOM 197198 / MUCL 43194) TaxID=747089 RepID=U9SSZ0_RHIID
MDDDPNHPINRKFLGSPYSPPLINCCCIITYYNNIKNQIIVKRSINSTAPLFENES